MKPGLTIAHVSDLHLDVTYQRENLRNTRRVLEYIGRVGVDHLVVTGDITADAEPRDLDVARKLFASFGFSSADRLSVVIGNHDVFGGINRPEEILMFPSRCRRTDYLQRTEDFYRIFAETFAGTVQAREGEPFPYIKDLGPTVLVGINSIAPYSSVANPVGSNGAVPDDDLRRLRKILAQREYRHKQKIVLIHHHFNKMESAGGGMLSMWGSFERQTMKLRKKRAVFEFLKAVDAGIVLHGHDHVNMEYQRKGITFLNGGATVLGQKPHTLHVNFLHVRSDRIVTELHTLPAASMRVPVPLPIASTPASSVTEEAA